MTISQKIIISSTLVAMLAALAAFMGWKNTQPIQQELVQKLTHATEEIHFLNDIKDNVRGIYSKVLATLKMPADRAVTTGAEYSKTGKNLDIHIKTLKVQIKSFEDFNTAPDNKKAIKKMLELNESLRQEVALLFANDTAFPEAIVAEQVERNANAIVNNFYTIIFDANHLLYDVIEKEGEAVHTQISKLNFWIILIGGLTFLMAIVFGQIIASNLSTEITQLRESAKQISEGNYKSRVDSKTNDEFGKLGKLFDGMAANLQQLETIEDQKVELERLSETLKTKNDSLDRFVYRVSHDLKAPVVNIKSLLSLIKLRMANIEHTTEVAQSFHFMEKSTDKLQQTIFDLLEVSRIERSLESPKEWLVLREALMRIETDHKEQILNNEVEITSDFQINEIKFSRTNLDSILSNLISNSIKYCTLHQSPKIHLKTESREGFICMSIVDNGLGIDLERHREKLFGMFNRFHNHVEGSGVGLYIVKKIMEESGGKVEVESEVGKGTVFRLFFKQEKVEAVAEV